MCFLKKVEVDSNKVANFVKWFCANEERMRRCNENMATEQEELFKVLDEIELELAKVYRDGYKGRIEFNYGGKDDEWEFNLFHLNKKFLIAATAEIADAISKVQLPNWKINTGK